MAVCYFCGQPVLPGQPWALRRLTFQARHRDCADIAPGEGEDVPSWMFQGLSQRQLADITEPGRACRVCGQYIDPDQDPRRTCPACGRMYHLACYGPDRECLYCASQMSVPHIAEVVSRHHEQSNRVLRDRYTRPRGGAVDGADEFRFQVICRGCLGFLEDHQSLARCGRCRKLFHTACMAGQGLCHHCAAGTGVPPAIEAWCRRMEREDWTVHLAGTCPECGAGIGFPNPGHCPDCGLGVEPPRLADRFRQELDWVADEESDRNYYEDNDDYDDWEDDADLAERHGWVENPNWCCACFPAPILFFACLMTFNKYLPDPWSDILIGLGITSLALALVVSGVMWVVNRVRARLWPMAKPSPLKSVLTVVRTVLYWLAGAAAVVGFTLLGSEVLLVPAMTLLVFAGITLATAILVSLFCLFIR